MNRINILFQKKEKNILSVYFTAGFPNLEDSLTILEKLQSSGVDMVEIGIPFSDPLADGPVIQNSSEIALKNGMTMRQLFGQLKYFRSRIHLPVLLMGYFNPIMQYGVENFVKECQKIGIDGVIIPDLPYREFTESYLKLFEDHNLKNIFLITPQTAESRIRMIDGSSNSFIYMVSSGSTTGVKGKISDEQIAYFKRIQKMGLKNPIMTGFGISNQETFEIVCKYSNGAIIGSAFINLLQKEGQNSIAGFISSIVGNKEIA